MPTPLCYEKFRTTEAAVNVFPRISTEMLNLAGINRDLIEGLEQLSITHTSGHYKYGTWNLRLPGTLMHI